MPLTGARLRASIVPAVDFGALAAVVLGAVLATASGVGTELWKQRRAARAAARLVWLELVSGYAVLLGAIAQERWPSTTEYRFADEAWQANRDRLAVAGSAEEFQQLQAVFLALGGFSRTPPAQRAEPVLYWPLLLNVNRALLALGEKAKIGPQLDTFRSPLPSRLAQVRAAMERAPKSREAAGKTFDDAVMKALDSFPPELRTRAADALSRQRGSALQGLSE